MLFGGARRRRALRWLALLPVVGASAVALVLVGPVRAGDTPAPDRVDHVRILPSPE